MTSITGAVQVAAETLQRISEDAAGERGQRAASVALVLRAVEAMGDPAGGGFVRKRAEAELAAVGSAGERAMLSRLLLLAECGGSSAAVAAQLVSYAGELERTRRLAEADAVMTLARTVEPASAEVALHAGRVARFQGDRSRAAALYRAARELDASGTIGRLAGVGEAVVSEDAEGELSRVIRSSVTARDDEAAAVALEERARIRRNAGRREAAVRDLCTAAARYPDAVDRARVAHELADLCVAAADAGGAREALLVALEVGDPTQRDHAMSRLHGVSRDLGDQLGMRRWRSFQRPSLVSMSPGSGNGGGPSLARVMVRWRERVVGAAR